MVMAWLIHGIQKHAATASETVQGAVAASATAKKQT